MFQSKSCLENLANEIFMDIFEYLSGQQIYLSFFHLNYRLNLLCDNYPKFSIDITDSVITSKEFRQFLKLIYSKNTRSMKFSAEKWLSKIGIKYFTSLNSLTFINVENPNKIKEFLEKLPSPDCLYYLSIRSKEYKCDIQPLLTTILKLPNLTRLELDINVNGSQFDSITVNQPSLSLRHLSIQYFELNQLLILIPFIPNLVSLNVSSGYYGHRYNLIPNQPNSLLKLKILRMNYVFNCNEINYILQLCPHLEVFQTKFHSIQYPYPMRNAKDWENLLKPMKFLKKIEIDLVNFNGSHTIDTKILNSFSFSPK